jgi:hypothetical protein
MGKPQGNGATGNRSASSLRMTIPTCARMWQARFEKKDTS